MKLRSSGWASIPIALLVCTPAEAAYIDFEPPAYSAGGSCASINGQSGWYTPAAANSTDGMVCSYAYLGGFGVPSDPYGGAQVALLHTTNDSQYSRAQYNLDFRTAAVWSISFDLTAVDLSSTASSFGSFYPGSFGLIQPSGSSFNVFDSWDSAAANSTWTANYGVYDSSGNQINEVPGAAWQGLTQGHWYRETTVFSMSALVILSVSIEDLSTLSTTTVDPSGWYLEPNVPPPGGVRMFGSGTTNAMLFDNIEIDPTPEPSTLFLAALGFAAIAIRR